jgi:hypothetical protein
LVFDDFVEQGAVCEARQRVVMSSMLSFLQHSGCLDESLAYFVRFL